MSIRSAYQTNEGDLLVVVGLAADEMVTVDDSTVVQLDDESTAASSATVGPAEVEAGESGVIVYLFEGIPLGGTLVYEVQNNVDAPVAVQPAAHLTRRFNNRSRPRRRRSVVGLRLLHG